jgi:hypothetical protein
MRHYSLAETACIILYLLNSECGSVNAICVLSLVVVVVVVWFSYYTTYDDSPHCCSALFNLKLGSI